MLLLCLLTQLSCQSHQTRVPSCPVSRRPSWPAAAPLLCGASQLSLRVPESRGKDKKLPELCSPSTSTSVPLPIKTLQREETRLGVLIWRKPQPFHDCCHRSSPSAHQELCFPGRLPCSRPAAVPTHLPDCSEDLLVVRLHLGEGPDLGQVHILTVAQGHNFIKGENQVKAVLGDLVLLQSSTVLGDLIRGKHFEGVAADDTLQTFSFPYPWAPRLC